MVSMDKIIKSVIFTLRELSSIDSAASSAAAAASRPVPSALRLLPSGLPSLLELARACDLYVITQCSSDASESYLTSDYNTKHAKRE